MIRKRVLVTGLVQGVGFRWSTRVEAEHLGVAGWVRNRPDGSVEAELEGPDAAVETMLGWLRVGPPGASVSELVVEPLAPVGATRFSILRH